LEEIGHASLTVKDEIDGSCNDISGIHSCFSDRRFNCCGAGHCFARGYGEVR